jgi:histidyl-tRNA synthetase
MPRIYVINDAFCAEKNGKEELVAFGHEHLPGVHVDGFIFDSNSEMKDQVQTAVRVAIDGAYDAVVLDVYFGDIGESSARLGIDLALPILVKAGTPVVVLSELSDLHLIDQNQHAVNANPNVRYLSASRIADLKKFLQATLPRLRDNDAKVDLGFRFWREPEFSRREKIKNLFIKLVKERGGEQIELPLIAPASNFLGTRFRPLQEKDSSKLFASVTTDAAAMAVRYEGTALAAKLVASEIPDGRYSHKYAYFQEMVRIEASKDLDAKHFRSFYQAGFEAFTTTKSEHHQNIADVLATTAEFLKRLGLDPVLRLSHLSIVPNVLTKLAVLPDYAKRKIIGVLEKGLIDSIRQTLKTSDVTGSDAEAIMLLADLRGRSLSEGLAYLQKQPEMFDEAIESFSTIIKSLKSCGLIDTCRFDPGIHRSLNFYSGITMQGDVTGMPECLGGGDFTGMVESFGPIGPVYSFGMAIGVERLLALDALQLD